MSRTKEIRRTTKETDILVELNLDGEGKSSVNTGIGFLDHMLNGFAKHGYFDLKVELNGDLEVDTHHSVEDLGIVLGTAIKEALGDKSGIKRYGNFLLPMDETLIMCAIDLSGRPFYSSDVKLTVEKVGDLETETINEFFYAVTYSCGMNLHFKQLSGVNNHHIIEAMFKAFAKALDDAVSYDSRCKGVLSTKGTL